MLLATFSGKYRGLQGYSFCLNILDENILGQKKKNGAISYEEAKIFFENLYI